MDQPAIDIHSISKTYRIPGNANPIHALQEIDLRVDRSMVFCILGPNGSGKTTLISILCGLLYPDAGRGTVWGFDLNRERRKIQAVVNFASGHANLPDHFTFDEMIAYFGMLYGQPQSVRRRKADELAEFFELQSYRNLPFNQLSTGLKQRVALAKALINDPVVLFLDEPTVGVDPQASQVIRSRLSQWHQQKGTTIILTTHQMDEAEQLSDHIAFLKKGRFIRMGSSEALKNSIRFYEKITIQGHHLSRLTHVLDPLPGVSDILIDKTRLVLNIDVNHTPLNILLKAVLEAGAVIDNMEINKPDLGDVFVALANQSDSV